MHHVVEAQDEVFAFLADPATHRGKAVHRIDTHAAVVFLAGDRALKVKRAVRFPFLDFSTVARRGAACRAELAVNMPFAPQIYRRVVPITREPDGRLALNGSGEPIEWAVEMNRFPDGAILAERAKDRRIDAALADALGRAVAQAHAMAPAIDPAPWLAAVGDYIEENDIGFRETPALFRAAEIDALDRTSRTTLERIRPLLVARGKGGLIRRIHGDLHLGNIVLIEGRPVLFDAIEFSPVIASGDVLYDLAFLLMDLVERDLGEAANIVLNRYLIETRRPEDLDALATLPFFLSLRAAIRAKVTAARLEEANPAQRPAIEQAARGYFRLARTLIAPPAPALLAVGGLSGTGKSVLARSLAPGIPPAPGAVVLRSDIERKLLLGVDEHEKLPPKAYADGVTVRVYAALIDKARRAIAAGHSAIVDAVFATPDERAGIAAVAHAGNVDFRGLFLVADLPTRLSRVGTRVHDASDADAVVARQQEGYELGPLDWAAIDASGTPDETLGRARGLWAGARVP